jgi:alpha-amylase/alpha-mannosidase (GH57 family)
MFLCFGIAASYEGVSADTDFDALYLTYKKLVSYLYSHPNFSFFWSLSGVQLEYYAKKHPEFINLLSKLVNRKQSELLGGGYYEPVLPVILPVDRIGQIEQFTTLQRKLIGKRPRGMWLTQNIWDTKIIDSLKNCGIDYMLLDSELMPQKNPFLPCILENNGKTIFALPVIQSLVPNMPSKDYLQKITALTQNNTQTNSVVAIMFTADRMNTLLETSWFDDFLQLCSDMPNIRLITPSQIFKESLSSVQAFIPPVMKDYSNIYDYLQNHVPIHLLYSRMTQVSLLVNQCRGDKNKKQAAREKLWLSQAGIAYYTGKSDFGTILLHRRSAYKNLIQAEKLAREISNFYRSILSFDINSDGINEFICQFDSYNAFITKTGGSVFELDVLKNCINYCDTHTPSEFFLLPADMLIKKIQKNIFVDHLLEYESPIDLPRLEYDSIFSEARYAEALFDNKRKEIRLYATVYFGSQQQRVLLKKNYLVTEHGLQVQYIVKNESPQTLRALFSVESSLSIPISNPEDVLIELISNNQNLRFETVKKTESKQDVSYVVFTDVSNHISFIFETNEDADFVYLPVFDVEQTSDIPYAVTGVFSWHVDLMPNMETEKIINLSIVTPRQKRGKAQAAGVKELGQ